MAKTKTRAYLVVTIIILFFVLLASILIFNYRAYLFVSFLIIISMMLPFFTRFEVNEIKARDIVMLAMLAAIAAVSRVPFAGLPSVQPTSFVIIMTGVVFGAESSFIVGAVAAIASNIFLGQGPWTPWQMYAWGMMGLSAGLLRHSWFLTSTWGKSVFGFVWGYLFGWFKNLWIVVSNIENLTWEWFLTLYASSIYFDLAHGLANVFFLILFSNSWMKIMNRLQRKYGLLA